MTTYLSPIGRDFLGDYVPPGPKYVAWAAKVRADGGRVTVMPLRDAQGRPLSGESPPAAAYPLEIWGPKVNARTWPMPDAYSTDGKTAFYRAPRDVQDEAKNIRTSATSPGTAAAAGKELEAKWWSAIFSAPRNAIAGILGIPPWLVTLGMVAGVAYAGKQLLDTFGVFRRNPRGRRRRRSRR